MHVAGIGCRRGCPADAIIALIRTAMTLTGCQIDALAAPEFKRCEPGLQAAAAQLGIPLLLISRSGLADVQDMCPTRSRTVLQATGHASIAEAAALAASGGPLLLARVGSGPVTCAIAGTANP